LFLPKLAKLTPEVTINMDLAQLKLLPNIFLIAHKTLWNFSPNVTNLSTQRDEKGTCSTEHRGCEKTPSAVQKVVSARTTRSHAGDCWQFVRRDISF